MVVDAKVVGDVTTGATDGSGSRQSYYGVTETPLRCRPSSRGQDVSSVETTSVRLLPSIDD
jgi:hypothetical protein